MSERAIAGVYAFCGADVFRRREAVAALCARIAKSEGDGQGPVTFEGESAQLAEVLDEVRTYSLLGGRRVVLVADADDFISRHRAALERYCAAPVDSGTLILDCKTLKSNERLYKLIEKNGGVTRFDELKGKNVADWIVERARETYGKRLDPRLAWMLREMSGSELGVLDGELCKLALYVGERAVITQQDIEALVGRHREQDVFAVLDALADGDAAGAMAHWERVLATDRAAPARAIAGLAWGVRKLLDIKQQADRGVSIHVLSRQAFASAEVLTRRLRATSLSRLQSQLCDLLDADFATKSGLSSVPTAIERFIIKYAVRPEPLRRRA